MDLTVNQGRNHEQRKQVEVVIAKLCCNVQLVLMGFRSMNAMRLSFKDIPVRGPFPMSFYMSQDNSSIGSLGKTFPHVILHVSGQL